MADPEPLTVDYFTVAAALGRALRHDSVEFWQVVAELERSVPGYDWRNAMTDSATDVLTPTPPAQIGNIAELRQRLFEIEHRHLGAEHWPDVQVLLTVANVQYGLIRSLADVDDPTVDDRDYAPWSSTCGLCGTSDPDGEGHVLDDPARHPPTCPWRKAREWLAGDR